MHSCLEDRIQLALLSMEYEVMQYLHVELCQRLEATAGGFA